MPIEILNDRYELIEHIGTGGMADVYKAHDLILDRLVAVKILKAQFSDDIEFIKQFNREAQGAAKLSHQNIVSIFDVGEKNGKHYIVMEYVPGITLKKLIKDSGHLSVNDSLKIAICIASALETAHKNNLVHCDIKPHNIIVGQDNSVKVADFGIARAVSASTITYNDTVLGSVYYISPEQAKGAKITPKSDIYSLGVVLYEMLTGALPFNGPTPVAIALKHIQDTPPSASEINPSIPLNVETLIKKALSKQVESRPDSNQLLKELHSLEKYSIEDFNNSAQFEENDQFATKVLPTIPSEDLDNFSEENQPFYKNIYHSPKLLVCVAFVLLLGFGIGSFLSFGKFWSASELDVPNVVGMHMTLAKQMLESKKLRVNFSETFNSEVPIGNVISQYPEANARVKEQRQITLYISKGGETINMPQLKGLSRSAAEEKIKNSGLKIGNIYEKYSNDADFGTVLAQEPLAHSKITKGQIVDFTVSKGVKKSKVILPDFTDTKLDFAKSSIISLKLQIGKVIKTNSYQPEGTIIHQTPSGGKEVNEGDVINLTVSNGKSSNGKANDTPSIIFEKAGKSKTK